MRLIQLRFLTATHVPALVNSLDDYQPDLSIAYKKDLSSPVYVLTTSNAVVNELYETNPNCHEIRQAEKFITDELIHYNWTNPQFLLLSGEQVPENVGGLKVS